MPTPMAIGVRLRRNHRRVVDNMAANVVGSSLENAMDRSPKTERGWPGRVGCCSDRRTCGTLVSSLGGERYNAWVSISSI